MTRPMHLCHLSSTDPDFCLSTGKSNGTRGREGEPKRLLAPPPLAWDHFCSSLVLLMKYGISSIRLDYRWTTVKSYRWNTVKCSVVPLLIQSHPRPQRSPSAKYAKVPSTKNQCSSCVQVLNLTRHQRFASVHVLKVTSHHVLKSIRHFGNLKNTGWAVGKILYYRQAKG